MNFSEVWTKDSTKLSCLIVCWELSCISVILAFISSVSKNVSKLFLFSLFLENLTKHIIEKKFKFFTNQYWVINESTFEWRICSVGVYLLPMQVVLSFWLLIQKEPSCLTAGPLDKGCRAKNTFYLLTNIYNPGQSGLLWSRNPSA